MIESFASKKLERFFEGDKRTVGPQMQRRATNILSALYAADTLEELNVPGYDLHPLKGDRKNFWSMKVSGNWRIIFRFQDGKAYDVDLVDYH